MTLWVPFGDDNLFLKLSIPWLNYLYAGMSRGTAFEFLSDLESFIVQGKSIYANAIRRLVLDIKVVVVYRILS